MFSNRMIKGHTIVFLIVCSHGDRFHGNPVFLRRLLSIYRTIFSFAVISTEMDADDVVRANIINLNLDIVQAEARRQQLAVAQLAAVTSKAMDDTEVAPPPQSNHAPWANPTHNGGSAIIIVHINNGY